MKNLMKFMMLPALLLAASACSSNDDPVVDNGTTSEGDVYMTFTLVNTSDGASRSGTDSTDNDDYGSSTDGVEIGTDAENTITSVQIFLVQDNVAFATSTGINFSSSTDKQSYSATFKNSDLQGKAGQTVDVMVYCNFAVSTTTETNNGVTTVTGYDVNQVNEGQSWGSTNISEATAGKFQMSNATTAYSSTLPSDLTKYMTSSNPWDLGTIKVERAAARIDIKQYNDKNEYALSDVDNGTVTITLQKFALINMNPKWYAFRRVSSEVPATTSSTTICGVETTNNWVVDWDWTAKAAWAADPTQTLPTFVYPLATPSTWVWTAFSELTRDDNNSTWNEENSKGDYKVWRYLNENTIPGIDAQKQAISTGVVFKGQLTATNEDISTAMAAGKTLYVFQNKLYGAWENVVACAENNAALQVAVDNSCTKEVDDVTQEVTYTVNNEKAAEYGFTGYSPDTDGNYYVYYYYWNRHNDNGKAAEMGTMEFAVVRNNVYKLCVTAINKYGHPTPGTDDPDPDPEDPDDPDEDSEVYFQVSLKVMPWVVRINNIDF